LRTPTANTTDATPFQSRIREDLVVEARCNRTGTVVLVVGDADTDESCAGIVESTVVGVCEDDRCVNSSGRGGEGNE